MNSRVMESNIIRNYYEHLRSLDPFLNEIHSRKTLHAGGTMYSKEDEALISPMKKMSITVEIRVEDVKNYRLEKFAENIYNIATGFIKKVNETMFESLNQLTAFTGQTMNAAGKPFSVDMFLDMLEKIEIRFDDEGKPIMPSIVAAPTLTEKIKNTKFTREQGERQRNIMEAKKKEFYDKKRYRRLSYLD